MSTPEQLRELAEFVARRAAALVREHAAGVVEVAATKSSDIDVVTLADRASEELIRRLVLEARPQDGFLGEEGNHIVGSSGVRWIVDPIDGTVNFLYGLGEYAVSVAAERDGEVVAGVVLDVSRDVVYAACVDGQAMRDGVPISVRGPAAMSHRLIATGFHYTQPVRRIQAMAVAQLLPHVRDIRRTGSCALDLCRVAAGTLDGYVEEGVHDWDHAAGGLIARAAGARTLITRGAGGQAAMVCAPDHGFDELLRAVEQAGFLRQ
ncbi:MAG: inositol monophosphatase [Nocardioidaceae bacterium]|nr:inositol monophosphatase [Nocardioidaceae bacterium]